MYPAPGQYTEECRQPRGRRLTLAIGQLRDTALGCHQARKSLGIGQPGTSHPAERLASNRNCFRQDAIGALTCSKLSLQGGCPGRQLASRRSHQARNQPRCSVQDGHMRPQHSCHFAILHDAPRR